MLNQDSDYQLFIHRLITADESFDESRKHAKKMLGHFLWRDKKFDVSRVTFVLSVADRHSTIFDLAMKGAKQRLCDTGCIEVNGVELNKK